MSVIPVDIPWSWKMNKAIILNIGNMEYSLKTNNVDTNIISIYFENELFMAKGKRIEEVLKFKIIILLSTNPLTIGTGVSMTEVTDELISSIASNICIERNCSSLQRTQVQQHSAPS